MSEILYIKEVERKNGLLTTTAYDYDRESETVITKNPISFTDRDDLYSYHFLNEESDEWVLRVYKIPNMDNEGAEDKLHDIFADMKEFGVTIAYVTKDFSFTAISIRDQGKPRLWDAHKLGDSPDLKNINITTSTKLAKRLAGLGTQTYLNTTSIIVLVEEDDFNVYPHIDGVMFVKITNIRDKVKTDGEFFIRPELRDELVTKIYDKMLPIKPEKAERLRRTLGRVCTFNTRLLFSQGYGKGDTVVSHTLTTDVEIDVENIKDELSMKSDSDNPDLGMIQMVPQDQMGKVYTDRQTICSFYDALLDVPTPGRDDSKNIIKDALTDHITDLIERFRAGKKMLHVDSIGREQDDSIRNVFQKLEAWTDAGKSVNDSLFLLMMLAGQVVDMLGCAPGQDDKKRRFPVPYASRHSIRNEYTYHKIHGVKLNLEYGEGFIDPDYGLFVSDETYEDMIVILGGADLDDHIAAHYRRAVGDHEHFNINDGDTVMVIIRNPVGIESDGTHIGSEYWVLKAAAIERVNLPARFGDLPELHMDKLPLCTSQIHQENSPSLTLDDGEVPDTYNKRYFREAIKASGLAQGAYGIHANLAMASRLMGVPLPFVAPEETFIDGCSTIREPGFLAAVRNNNEVEKDILSLAGVAVDHWMKERVGLDSAPGTYGVFCDLVDYHVAEVNRFEQAAREHIKAVKDGLESKFADAPVTRMQNGVPILLDRVAIINERYRESVGKANQRLTFSDFEMIGNKLMERIHELEADPKAKQTPELTTQDFQEAYAWIWSQVKPSRYNDIRSMYYDTDQKIMMGAMFDRLIEAL